MLQFLVATHHSDDYDPATAENQAMMDDIHALNVEMQGRRCQAFRSRPPLGTQREVAASSVRWQSAHHQGAISSNQEAHRRLLGAGDTGRGRGTSLEPKSRPRRQGVG